MGSRAVKAKMPISSAGSDHRAPESGFTLIEVLVVLVILALAMAVVVPAIGKGVGGSLDDAARDVQLALRKARSEAVMAQRSTAVLLDVEAKKFRLERSARQVSLPESIALNARVAESELKDGVAGIRFFPDGSSTGGAFSLARGDSHMSVNVDWLTGRVSIDHDDE